MNEYQWAQTQKKVEQLEAQMNVLLTGVSQNVSGQPGEHQCLGTHALTAVANVQGQLTQHMVDYGQHKQLLQLQGCPKCNQLGNELTRLGEATKKWHNQVQLQLGRDMGDLQTKLQREFAIQVVKLQQPQIVQQNPQQRLLGEKENQPLGRPETLHNDFEDPLLQEWVESQMRETQRRPMQPELAAAMLQPNVQGERWFTKPPTASQCDVQLQMLGGASVHTNVGVTPGLIHPLLTTIMSDRPKLTAKRQGGWRAFDKKWEERYEMMVSCNRGGPPPDPMILADLKECLDEEDKILLEHEKEKNKYLSYQDFYEILREMYDKDEVSRNRRAWEALTFPSGELTVEKWETFRRQFRLLRDRVEDWTHQEEYKNLTQLLPRKWLTEVVKLNDQNKGRTYFVRISGLPTTTDPMTLKHRLEVQTQEYLDAVTPLSNGGYRVQCKDPTIMSKLLKLNGTMVEDRPIRCVKMDKELSGDEIFAHVLRKLEQEEVVNQMLTSRGRDGLQVHAIASPEAKKSITPQEAVKWANPATPTSPRSPQKPEHGYGRKGNKGKGRGGGNRPTGRGRGIMNPGQHNPHAQQNSYAPRNSYGQQNSFEQRNAYGKGNTAQGKGKEKTKGGFNAHHCLTCARKGNDPNHPYYLCSHWQKEMDEKHRGGKGAAGGQSSSSPQRTEGQRTQGQTPQ